MSKAIQDALNEQITNELNSAHLYLSMSAYCQSTNLPGFAHWLRLQNQEEIAHAMKLFGYIYDRGGRVVLREIAKPPVEFKSALALMQQTLEHEQRVTVSIHKLYELSVKEKDYATQTHLQWFITEQVEEEKQAGQVVERLKMVGNQGPGLFMLDKELGARASAG